MSLIPAAVSALCALLGVLAGYCATARQRAADMAELRSRLGYLGEMAEETRLELRRLSLQTAELAQRLARQEEAAAQAQRWLDRFVN